MLRFMGSQRVGHDWATELTELTASQIFTNLKYAGLPWWSSGWESACWQGTWVRSLVQEDSTCCEGTELVCHNY